MSSDVEKNMSIAERCSLQLLWASSSPDVDIIAIQDQDEQKNEAWTYNFVKIHDAAQKSTTETMQPPTDPGIQVSLNWLNHATMVPAAIPMARVMAFSYPSYKNVKVLRQGLSKYIDDITTYLVSQLKSERTGVRNRPIMWIARGFGGLLVQKALPYSSQDDDVKSLRAATAGILFIDTPYPALSSAKVPNQTLTMRTDANAYGSARMRRIGKFLANNQSSPVNTESLWKEFTEKQNSTNQKLQIVWLYNKSQMQKRFPDQPLEGILFKPLVSDEYQKTTQYWDAEDPNYREVLVHLKRFLLLRAAASADSESLLKQLLDLHYPVNVTDGNGWSALYVAAGALNNTGVTMLLEHGGVAVTQRDHRGKTPLHAAVIKVVENNEAGEVLDQEKIEGLIKQIFGKTLNIDELDRDRKTAWDYVDGKENLSWIKDIRKGRGRNEGPKETTSKLLETLEQPKDKKLDACRNFNGVLADFFLDKEGDKEESRMQEYFNYETPTVLELIYDEERAKDRLLSRLAGSKARWIHLPANNEQWVIDLFKRMGIKDESMMSKSHDGDIYYQRYKHSGAKFYGHAHKQQSPKTNSGPNQSQSEGDFVDQDAIVLFMPLLGFETDKKRKAMTKAIETHRIRRHQMTYPTKGDELLLSYLNHHPPLHCRRTLDQFSYYMLETTERRDSDQVAFKWAKDCGEANRPILMVDQLWLWILDKNTVVTAFPNMWDADPGQGFSLQKMIEEELGNNKTRWPIETAQDVVDLILKMSVNFFDKTGPADFQFQECFQSSICSIIEKHANLLKDFCERNKYIKEKISKLNTRTSARLYEKLCDITEETKLLIEIIDIQDELNVVCTVLKQQETVIGKLQRIYKRISDRKGDKKKDNSGPKQTGLVSKSNPSLVGNKAIVMNNLTTVKEMAELARKVEKKINQLLNLKQKQTNAAEARFSRESSEAAHWQSSIICVLTLVTTVFLPLTFITSIIALPLVEYPRYPKEGSDELAWPSGKVFTWIFGVGFAGFAAMAVFAMNFNRISNLVMRKKFDKMDMDSWNSDKWSEDSPTKESDKILKSSSADDGEYALLFGTYSFHKRIPLLRRLWKYRNTQPIEDDFSVENYNADNYPTKNLVEMLKSLNMFKAERGNDGEDYGEE